jgi:hypothetical protein
MSGANYSMSDRHCRQCGGALATFNQSGFCKACQQRHIGEAGEYKNARYRIAYRARAAARPTRTRKCEVCSAVMLQIRHHGRPPITCSPDCAKLHTKIRRAT